VTGVPETRYARSGGVTVAYQVVGDGPVDLVYVPGFLSHIEWSWVHPEPERVLTTLLFTEIVGSTERASELGDRRWREVLEDHYALVRRELARFRGREVQTVGDAFFVTFDSPTRAIRCAAAVLEAARPLGVELRAGVHTGECELIGDDLGGIAVHVGARIAAAAQPGEVLVSSTVRDLVDGSGVRFEDRGAFSLKGVDGERQLFAARVER